MEKHPPFRQLIAYPVHNENTGQDFTDVLALSSEGYVYRYNRKEHVWYPMPTEVRTYHVPPPKDRP